MFELRDLLANRSWCHQIGKEQMTIWDFLDPERHEGEEEV